MILSGSACFLRWIKNAWNMWRRKLNSFSGLDFKNPLMALSIEDIVHVQTHTQDVWTRMHGKRVFLTGGTGFFGCWLVESFLSANSRLRLGCELVILTRNRQRFSEKAPHLVADPALRVIEG